MAYGDSLGPDLQRDRSVTPPTDGHERARLEKALGHHFSRAGLLSAALTHSSASVGARKPEESFERLEFLGDRVLGLAVADMLLARYPEENEGALSRRLVGLVRREALVEVARSLDLERYLTIAGGPGARRRAADRMLADGCEALIGAIYLDAGFDTAAEVVRNLWTPLMDGVRKPPQDAKTVLQEWAQGQGRPLPVYTVVGREGADHQPTFSVEVSVEGIEPVVGSGLSKRAAEQAAAAALLARIGHVC